MIEHFNVTASETTDGYIELEQCDINSQDVVRLHPDQLKLIARQMCGMKPETAERITELERRIAVLTDKLQEVACNSHFRRGVLDGSSDGLFYLAKIDAVVDLALEFDGGRLEPETEYEEPPIYPPPTKPAQGQLTL